MSEKIGYTKGRILYQRPSQHSLHRRPGPGFEPVMMMSFSSVISLGFLATLQPNSLHRPTSTSNSDVTWYFCANRFVATADPIDTSLGYSLMVFNREIKLKYLNRKGPAKHDSKYLMCKNIKTR